ncbi:Arc family DNA-binding protein [Candidatus Sumerlaeota bacterium]
MPSITVKNIPEETYRELKSVAVAHRRSINSEILTCLENSLHSRRIDPDAFLARIDALSREHPLPRLTDKLLRAAKSEGRP